jgi:hypothetical protein
MSLVIYSEASIGNRPLFWYNSNLGEVSEWSNETVLKTVVQETVPWVRIPPSPPC